MAKINDIEEKLREEQQKMMFALYTGDCLDKYEWIPRFKEVLNSKRRYTIVEVKRIKKRFRNCNVLLSTFESHLELKEAV